MKKKTLLTICAFLLGTASIALAQTDSKSVSLKVYYPPPRAAYDELQLLPSEYDSSADTNTDNWDLDDTVCSPGQIIYHSPTSLSQKDYALFSCTAESKWQYLTKPWSYSIAPETSPANPDSFDVYINNSNVRVSVTDNILGYAAHTAPFRLTLNNDGGILSMGLLKPNQNYATLSTSDFSSITHGAGTRLLWYPKKTAFRAGYLNTNASTNWDDPNIGSFSSAFGFNTLSRSEGALVLSGGANSIQNGDYSVIAGGFGNQISTSGGTVPDYAVIAGGSNNFNNSSYSFIGGGQQQQLNGESYNTIIGGSSARMNENVSYSTIGSTSGGRASFALAHYCGDTYNPCSQNPHVHTIVGGEANTIFTTNNATTGSDEANCTIGGGVRNDVRDSQNSIVAGGYGASDETDLYFPVLNNSPYSIIGGGQENHVDSARYATILGGGGAVSNSTCVLSKNNKIDQNYGTIFGGEGNYLSPSDNADSTKRCVIVGGRYNRANNDFSASTGPDANSTSAFIGGGGGPDNPAGGLGCPIINVLSNYTKGGFIGGGYVNKSYAYQSGIGGGKNNTIGDSNNPGDRGWGSYIPGGEGITVTGKGSWAGGKNVVLHTNYSFLWGHTDNPATYPIKVGTEGDDTAPPVFIIADNPDPAATKVKVGIQTTNPQAKLDVAGDMFVNGTMTLTNLAAGTPSSEQLKIDDSGQIGLDLAEHFESSAPLGAGTVVMIDPSTGKLAPADHPYDPKVIGIVSTAPAVIFEGKRVIMNPDPKTVVNQNKLETPVALKGRVPVKICLENGPVRPGDILTSSSLPGYAMRSTDPEKSWGTTIGKALEGFSGGPNGETKGTILTFVTLH